MANDMTDSDMAGTTISRHVGELEPLTTEQHMAWSGTSSSTCLHNYVSAMYESV